MKLQTFKINGRPIKNSMQKLIRLFCTIEIFMIFFGNDRKCINQRTFQKKVSSP